jgi:hypothetical protein
MPFTEEETASIHYHLGYPLQQTGVALSFGIPVNQQTMFLVTRAIPLLPEVAVQRVRRILAIFEDMEQQMVDAQIELSATQLEDLSLRQDHLPQLRKEYRYWQSRMAQLFGVPINPDFSGVGSVDDGVGNVTVG